MDIALIAAMAENRVIGRDNALPWHISADLKNFRRITMGKPVVMGRRTYDSIGRPLPGRPNVVVTRDPHFAAEGVHAAPDMDAALSLARELGAAAGVAEIAAAGAAEIMVIGGGQIYEAALNRARRLYLTLVHEHVDGDAYFPAYTVSDWREVSRERHPPEDASSPGFSFLVLERAIMGDAAAQADVNALSTLSAS